MGRAGSSAGLGSTGTGSTATTATTSKQAKQCAKDVMEMGTAADVSLVMHPVPPTSSATRVLATHMELMGRDARLWSTVWMAQQGNHDHRAPDVLLATLLSVASV